MMLQAYLSTFLEGTRSVRLPPQDSRLLWGSVLLLGHLLDLVVMRLQGSSNQPYSLRLELRGHFPGRTCQEDSWQAWKYR